MNRIESKHNPLFKQTRRIAQGKERDAVWLEGVHLVQDWLAAGYQVEAAFFDSQRLEQQAELQQLALQLPTASCTQLTPQLMQQLTQVKQGQGVGAVVQAPRYDETVVIDHNCVYLDRIQDPGNLGTLLRTMAAAGIQHAYLSPGCAWAWSQKVLRSAQGAHFALQIHENIPVELFLQRVTVPVYATALAQAMSLYEVRCEPEVAWVFGNEGQGVATELLAAAQQRVFIPQVQQVESLNVAAAAAVCLFEQRRQQHIQNHH